MDEREKVIREMKQFDLQTYLAHPEKKVVTRDGRPARVICTDAKADDGACIIALIPDYGGEEAYQFFPDGLAFSSKSSVEDCADLFFADEEPEIILNGVKYKQIPAKTDDKICKDCDYFLDNGHCDLEDCPCDEGDFILERVKEQEPETYDPTKPLFTEP